MCQQCAGMAAVAATTGGFGLRVWLAARTPEWLGEHGLRAVSACVVTGTVVAAGLLA